MHIEAKAMRRTRKWSFVKQEAIRLAAMNLTPLEIAKRLQVNKSTVTRWMQAGQLARTVGQVGVQVRRPERPTRPVSPAAAEETPEEWAARVRAEHALDASDQQLVRLAVMALNIAYDTSVSVSVRLAAAGEFQRLVRQLGLVVRETPKTETPEPPKRQTFELPRRSGADPRTILTAV